MSNALQAQNTQAQNTTATQEQAPAKLSPSERFTNAVLREFKDGNGDFNITEYQRQLIQGYFIGIDRALKTAEADRERKNSNNKDHKYDNELAYSWENVNLSGLAQDLVHCARLGLDMLEDNHLFPIPYKNNKAEKYDMTLMLGYNGKRYITEKYAMDKPLLVTIELVYSTDTFKPIKKSGNVAIESYEFAINNPFERGNIVGGFGYIQYAEPQKNRLIIMTLTDIEKRRPKKASANFWGGKTKEWQNGKQVDVETEGWYAEMCLKTVIREVYSSKNMPRDPKKIDDNYQFMKMQELQSAELEAQAEITANANGDIIDTEGYVIEPTEQFVNTDSGEINDPDEPPHPDSEAQQTLLEPSF